MGKTKFEIKFNPKARLEYLTGFKKRKDERRQYAKDKIKIQEKEKKKEIKAEKRKHRDRIEEQYQQVTFLKKQEQEEIQQNKEIHEKHFYTEYRAQEYIGRHFKWDDLEYAQPPIKSGGHHLASQQYSYISPQENNRHDNNQKQFPAPFANLQPNVQQILPHVSNLASLTGAANSNIIMINQNQQNQQLLKRKHQHGGSATGASGSEQRQLYLAEMVRGSNIMKHPSTFQKKDIDYIKGTQVQKDFQLIAEPIVPKSYSQQPPLSHNSSQHQNLKTQLSSQVTYSNTAITSYQDKQSSDGSGLGVSQPSQNSSRKNLDTYYSNVKNEIIPLQNPAIQQLILQQNSQQYSTNRSVAAKAGQMQIFSNDKYNHLNTNNSTQHNKFQSPPSHIIAKQIGGHHQSASQQIENIMDLQQLKVKQSGGPTNNKYNEYLHRFSTNQSIDQTQNLQMKYRDLRSQILDDETNPKYTAQPVEQVQSMADQNPTYEASQNFHFKKSPNNMNQKENKIAVVGLGVSGEQMHLEEKSLLKKMGILVGHSIEGNISSRHAGSGRKRQEISVKGVQRGFKGAEPLLQSKTRYDYVFIRMTEDQFEKEFSDKVAFTKEEQSSNNLNLQNQRITNITKDTTVIHHILQMPRNQKSLRGSQEISRDNNMFSPINKIINKGIDDQMQNYSGEESLNQLATQQQLLGQQSICSIISTNHTHIKVIANQGLIGAYGELTQKQSNQQQIALNECVHDVMTKVQEKGRVVKTTLKKKYILNALNAPNLRVASIYVVVIDNSVVTQDTEESSTTMLSDSSSSSTNNFNSTLSKLQNPKVKELLKKEIKINDNQILKNIRVRNNSTIHSKGYESEGEAKSTNSTTTSSTLQHFIPTRNFDQNGGSITTKNSSRSLSQKGTQPRKNFQKTQPEEVQQVTSVVIPRDVNAKKYPPTKIKIVSPFDYTHLESHRINVALANYNNFIQLCFKQKGKINVIQIVKLGKQLGIPITANMFTDGIIKSREQANMLKEKLISYICKVMNEENYPENMPDNPLVQEAIIPLIQPIHQYKCFVGKGNNSILIRTLFKTRFWWLLHDKEEIEKVNFMWTQLRKNPIMDTFPCKFEDKKSGLRTGGSSNNVNSALQTPGKIKSKKKVMQIQNSCISLENTGSNDKKDAKTEKEPAQATQVSQISQASQQLSVKIYNKLEDNFHLSNKKAMFLNIRLYYEAMGKDVFNAVPMTFHIKEGLDDPEFNRFKTFYYKEEEEVKKQKASKGQVLDAPTGDGSLQNSVTSTKRNIWIVKPGENTNCGQGITVLKEFEEIKTIIQESTANKKRTCIVQKYIHNPLLINKRKFDIRLYAFLSSVNGNIKGYFYSDGYLRTSCREFTLANLSNRMIHLTNDAVQKHAEDYGKFEAGNKLSYTDFQNYLDKNYADLNICFERDLVPQMKKLVTDMFRAVYGKIDPKRRVNNFEIYGYDFMFDDDFKVYLIEVNTNPCLELGCPLLARLIPTMVENALRLVVDPLFPAPENWSQKKCVVGDVCPENKYELIFDDKIDGPYLTDLMKEKNNIIIEIDEEELSDDNFEEEGEL